METGVTLFLENKFQRGPLNGALPGPYAPVQVTRGGLVTHRYTYALPCSRLLQDFCSPLRLSVSLLNDLADPIFNGVGLTGF